MSAVTSSVRVAAADAISAAILPPRQVEKLDRGIVAVRSGTGSVYVGWRLLVDDAAGVSFNLYRLTNGGTAVLRTSTSTSTNFSDTTAAGGSSYTYFVKPVVGGVEGAASASFTLAASTVAQPFINLPLQRPAGGTVKDSANPTGPQLPFTYDANDASVADVDGDGQYEIILKWDPTNAKDNSQSGYTGNVYIDAYKLNGTRLWRIDLGKNIRAGAHYTQFQAYDYDGDGKAEIAMKTAPGTIDGAGSAVLMGSDSATADYRNSGGYILSGPEYLTMFNGQTGAAMSTVAYDPARGITTNNPSASQLNSLWGDDYGNRVDRFLAGTAYLDGQRPSLVMSRGYYTRTVIATYDFRNGQLVQRWKMDTNGSEPQTAYRGQGAHSLAIADVDNDGRDEIVFGAATINDNGRGLYTTTLGHGDAEHVSDFIPSRPGQEIFMVHEDPGSYDNLGVDAGGSLHDAATGELLMAIPGNGGDVGRGNAFDIDPRYPGAEYWTTASGSIWNFDAVGVDVDGDGVIDPRQIQGKPTNMFHNFGIQWDADPLYELLDGTTIGDWRSLTGGYGRQNFDLDPNSSSTFPPNASSNNSTKSTPALAADILGDWRDEVIWRATDSSSLFIYTTTILATKRQFTAMQDIQYREAIAWQNTGYNQPAHPSWFQGEGMATPPTPNVYFAGQPSAEAALLDNYQAESAVLGGGSFPESINGGYEGSGYVNAPATGGGSIQWSNLSVGGGGAATIRLRYALGGTASRVATLTVNGVATQVSFAPTGSFSAWQTMSIGIDVAPYAPLTVQLSSATGDLPNVDSLQVRRLADVTVPSASSINFDAANTGKTILVQFTEDVSASLVAGDLIITNVPAAGSADAVVPVAATAVSFDPATNIATFTLPTVANGDYRATIARTGVSDAANNLLAANGVTTFFILAGDMNRDRTVNFSDLVILAQNYGQSGRKASEGDVNGDGMVDFSDLVALAQNYNVTLPAATAASAPMTASLLAAPVRMKTRTTSKI